MSGVAASYGASVYYRFSGLSGQRFNASFSRVSGTAQDGIYQAYLTVPAAYPSGNYYVDYLSAYDAASNAVSLNYPAPPTTSGTITVGNAAPVLTGLSPASTPAGGDPFNLTVFGSNFQNGATVYWNGAARATTFVSPTQLTAAISGADIATPGTAAIRVVNPDGQYTVSSLTFTIAVPPPRVLSVTPGSGPATGGTSVTITGKYFQSGATVSFNGATATSVVVVSSTQITAVTNGYPTGGFASVTVRNPDGKTGTGGVFDYILRPGAVLPGAQPNPEPGGRSLPSDPSSPPAPVPVRR